MIPKIIHYCWFGEQAKSKEVNETITHWKNRLPNYEFKEWNEKCFDVEQMEYTKQAYASGKMAFVSDVARIYALYQYGGVYLDTDIEICRDFTPLLEKNKVLLGFENTGTHIMTAFIASKRKQQIWCDLLTYYKQHTFINSNGELDLMPNTTLLTKYLEKYGLKKNNRLQSLCNGVTIYPEDYFSAHDFKFLEDISTEYTYTIHHCNASWMPKKIRFNLFVKKGLIQLLGHKSYQKIYAIIWKKKS